MALNGRQTIDNTDARWKFRKINSISSCFASVFILYGSYIRWRIPEFFFISGRKVRNVLKANFQVYF